MKFQILQKLAGILAAAVLTVMPTFTLSAQESATVTGTVTDETGAQLPGVVVMVKGTSDGTITDTEGRYTPQLAGGGKFRHCP